MATAKNVIILLLSVVMAIIVPDLQQPCGKKVVCYCCKDSTPDHQCCCKDTHDQHHNSGSESNNCCNINQAPESKQAESDTRIRFFISLINSFRPERFFSIQPVSHDLPFLSLFDIYIVLSLSITSLIIYQIISNYHVCLQIVLFVQY
jgi:hypothetical protein